MIPKFKKQIMDDYFNKDIIRVIDREVPDILNKEISTKENILETTGNILTLK